MLILEILAGIILTGIVLVVLFGLFVFLVKVLKSDSYPVQKRNQYGPVGAEIIEAREAWKRVARANRNDYHADCQSDPVPDKGGNP